MRTLAILLLSLTLNQKISQLNIETATIKDVTSLFGEPMEYLWGSQKFEKDKLPDRYIARFSPEVNVMVVKGEVVELRLRQPGVKLLNAIGIGSSLDDVFQVLGRPRAVVEGEIHFQPGVLYKGFQGKSDLAYYSSRERGLRLFFEGNRITEMCLSRKNQFPPDEPVSSRTLSGIMPFDDVRNVPIGARHKDATQADFSGKPELLATLTFNRKTVWPEAGRMPASPAPDALLKAAMNPGLGVRELHAKGITGKGVGVAIIDQPLFQDHPEYAGKIVAYHDVGTGAESSMHGPAVASLLVGKNIGTAPGARLHFVAAPSWTGDAASYAQALEWLLQQNRKLPKPEKIRVVSVSAAPSGEGSPFKTNREQWDKAVEAAEREGVLVLDCTRHHGIIGRCWFDGSDREKPSRCVPGSPESKGKFADPKRVMVPSAPRTTAEVYLKDDFGYQYGGRGGLSWSIPYAAGVLAMGWQVRPELGPQEMVTLLFQTAYRRDAETLIIDPPAFIRAVQRYGNGSRGF